MTDLQEVQKHKNQWFMKVAIEQAAIAEENSDVNKLKIFVRFIRQVI